MKNNRRPVELSIIIVNWNVEKLLDECLNSIYLSKGVDMEVIVVDNDSSDKSVEMVKEKYPQVILIEAGTNSGFSKGNNMGFLRASGKFLLILNPDTRISDYRTLRILLDYMSARPDIGILGPKLLKENGSMDITCKRKLPGLSADFIKLFLLHRIINIINNVFRRFPALYYEESGPCECISGSAMLFRAEVFRDLKGFDESVPMYLDDVDICYRSRHKGLVNFYLADAAVIHAGKGSTRKSKNYKLYDVLAMQARLFYYRKHYGIVKQTAYRLMICISVPYLLFMDLAAMPLFFFGGRYKEFRMTVKKHFSYIELAVKGSTKII